MREALIPLCGQRVQVTATVGRYGARPVYRGFHEQTLLLRDVATADGTPLCDHVWLIVGARLAAAALAPGDTITFAARVRAYQKHRIYRKRAGGVVRVSSETDYTLGYPSRIIKAIPTAAERSI